MLAIFDDIRGVSLLSVSIRMVLAMFCGGLIGLEREFKRRPAGFRTHILICIGSAVIPLISLYLLLDLHYSTDPARLGAQVIAGIGFIGAGTIIVTPRQRIKGLTTAAGLWTVAIIGLAIGTGFYEGALVATGLILLAELFFSRLEYKLIGSMPEITLCMEHKDQLSLEKALKLCREREAKVSNIEINRQFNGTDHSFCVIFTLRLGKSDQGEKLIEDLHRLEGVVSVLET